MEFESISNLITSKVYSLGTDLFKYNFFENITYFKGSYVTESNVSDSFYIIHQKHNYIILLLLISISEN